MKELEGIAMKRAAALAVLGAAAFVLPGCGSDYEHTEITGIHPSPLGGNMNYARVQVPLGMIMTSHIVSYDTAHDTMAVELHAKDPTIVEVTNVVTEHDYAFIGLKTGETDIELKADGKLVLIFTARVVDQPAPP